MVMYCNLQSLQKLLLFWQNSIGQLDKLNVFWKYIQFVQEHVAVIRQRRIHFIVGLGLAQLENFPIKSRKNSRSRAFHSVNFYAVHAYSQAKKNT